MLGATVGPAVGGALGLTAALATTRAVRRRAGGSGAVVATAVIGAGETLAGTRPADGAAVTVEAAFGWSGTAGPVLGAAVAALD